METEKFDYEEHTGFTKPNWNEETEVKDSSQKSIIVI